MIGRVSVEYDSLAFEKDRKTYIAIVKDVRVDPN